MPRVSGKCKWFDPKKGYGFITLDNGEDVFVHQSEIHANGFRSLREDERVELEIVLENNKKKAIRVTGPRGDFVKGVDNGRFDSGFRSDGFGGDDRHYDGGFRHYDRGYRQDDRDFSRGRRF